MELFQERNHQKSLETYFLILIAVVLANGGLLLTTGHYLFIFYIIAKQDAINSFKYSPKINGNTFSHSDCCSTCQWWAFTYYGSLFVDILHNSETG